VNTVTMSFNTIAEQMTEMSQRKKTMNKVKVAPKFDQTHRLFTTSL